jgi:hypothetical protein
MITKDKTKWAYVAAFIDADGCIGISRTILKTTAGNPYYGYDLKTSIGNTSLKVMRWLVRYFGGQFRPKAKNSSKLSDDPGFEWFMNGGYKKMEIFLLGILPYLVIKKEQCLLALSFVRLDSKPNPAMRASFHEQCMALNSGKSPTTNTLDASYKEAKIESDLHSDMQSDPVVIQES